MFQFALTVEMPLSVRKDLETDWLTQRFIPVGNQNIILQAPVSATDTVLPVNKILLGGGTWGSTAMRTNSMAVASYFPQNAQAQTALPSMLIEGDVVVLGADEPATIQTIEGPDEQGIYRLTVSRGKTDEFP